MMTLLDTEQSYVESLRSLIQVSTHIQLDTHTKQRVNTRTFSLCNVSGILSEIRSLLSSVGETLLALGCE